jgi:hypothetical protein
LLAGNRCGAREVLVAVARPTGDRCRFLGRDARLGSRRSCRRPRWLAVTAGDPWALALRGRVARGEHLVTVRGESTRTYRLAIR